MKKNMRRVKRKERRLDFALRRALGHVGSYEKMKVRRWMRWLRICQNENAITKITIYSYQGRMNVSLCSCIVRCSQILVTIFTECRHEHERPSQLPSKNFQDIFSLSQSLSIRLFYGTRLVDPGTEFVLGLLHSSLHRFIEVTANFHLINLADNGSDCPGTARARGRCRRP